MRGRFFTKKFDPDFLFAGNNNFNYFVKTAALLTLWIILLNIFCINPLTVSLAEIPTTEKNSIIISQSPKLHLQKMLILFIYEFKPQNLFIYLFFFKKARFHLFNYFGQQDTADILL